MTVLIFVCLHSEKTAWGTCLGTVRTGCGIPVNSVARASGVQGEGGREARFCLAECAGEELVG